MAATALAAQAPAPRIRSEVTNEMSALKGGPQMEAQFDAGPMSPGTRLESISIVFNRSAAQQADLDALLAAQQNPASPLYHQWLTPDQFAARFGMAQSDIDKVRLWLQQQGFSVDYTARSRNMIRFSGTVGQVEQAFRTQMRFYSVNGTMHFGPASALSVPSAIAPVVEGVRNLSDFKPRSMHAARVAPVASPAFTSYISGNVFFAPGDIKMAYDPTSAITKNFDGTGQTIAIMGQSAIVVSDIENFQKAAGLTVKDPTQVLVPGTGTSTISSGDESESDLDLEWSGAMAPGADIFFVYTGNSTTSSGVFDSITYAVDQKIGDIISVSYGACETVLQGYSLESVFKQAASQGQTILSASGDQGSTSCNGVSSLTTAQQQALAVNYPASSPYVTGVGGTEIDNPNTAYYTSSIAYDAAYYTSGSAYWAAKQSTDVITSALQWLPEVTWNDDSSSFGLSATGGGVSALFSKPTWQGGVPGIPNDSKRDVPDISLYSSPNFVAYLYCTSDTSAWQPASGTNPAQAASCNSGFRDGTSGGNYLTLAGGTSFATPVFAGMLALINQQKNYPTGQGLINPTLYTLASNSATYAAAFHDITIGNNNCLAGTTYCGTSTAGYSAGTGYDLATGLGSVQLAGLSTAWPANSGGSAGLIDTTTAVTASTATPTSGTNVTFTIKVASSTGSTIPSGTVNLAIDQTLSGGGTTATATLDGTGTATYTTSFTTSGTHVVVANYAGDTTHAASTGAGSVTIGGSTGTASFRVSASPSTLTVKQGTSGQETLTFTPSGGYTGTIYISFTASNSSALANLCYNFTKIAPDGSSGQVTVSGTTAASTTFTLDTNAADCNASGAGYGGYYGYYSGKSHMLPMRAMMGTHTSRNNAPNPAPAGLAFAGLLLAGFMARYSKKLRGVAGVIALVALGLTISACGGGGGGVSVPNPSKGTYTITVTGKDSTNTALTASTTFTFVID
ncbi:MAG: Ig-like domain repeat protein [Acidobacteriota bacterium]|nr:Ig-like domain repeat protein [Acidobacteriota bacterium]